MYTFNFKGGSYVRDNKQIKFHLYVTTAGGSEKHIFQAEKEGLVDRLGKRDNLYSCVFPVVKIFTSTKGFGIPSEYFSYFFNLSNTLDKKITILPLGRKYLMDRWMFSARGRFLDADEIRRLYGKNSNTFKYFTRQSMISKRRLMEMISVETVDSLGEITQTPEVRKLRT